MNQLRRRLLVAVLCTVLFLIVLAATIAVSLPISFRYGNTPGFSLARNVVIGGAALSAVGLLLVIGMIAIPAALQPGTRRRKFLYILPAYTLGFTLTGAVLALLGIGTAGNFIGIWLGVGVLLTISAMLVALVRTPLGATTLRRATTAISLTAVASLIAWLALVGIVVIVLTSQPSTLPRGGIGQQGTAATATSAADGQGQPAQDEGGPGGRGGPGGPGRGSTSSLPLLIGTAVLTLVAVGEGVSGLRAQRSAREGVVAATTALPPAEYNHETGRAIFTALVLTIGGLALSQLVPISHTNPPVQTSIAWDSPQTARLAKRACMDCHSNTTTYPWYSYIAPSSWLLASHISSGRDKVNLSTLNTLQSSEKQRLPNDMAREIRNGSMPPSDYLIMHPEARLSVAEKQQLIQGLQKSLSQ